MNRRFFITPHRSDSIQFTQKTIIDFLHLQKYNYESEPLSFIITDDGNGGSGL